MDKFDYLIYRPSELTTKITVDELDSKALRVKGLQFIVGKFVEGEDWAEKQGPTPFPGIMELRDWDRRLLEKYPPLYSPLSDFCEFCTYGKCDLTADKKGACGINMAGHMGKWSLLQCVMGAAAHTTHAHHMISFLISKYGRDLPLDLGNEVEVEAPITRLIAGIKPQKLGDLEEVITYLESQITHLTSATATGQEQHPIDFESKSLHAGMLDNLALEISDIAQISALGLPKGDPSSSLVQIGLGVVDRDKPVVLCVGHNVAPGSEVINYLEKTDSYGLVEVAGICCTGADLARFSSGVKFVGPVSRQLRFVRTGIADVMIIDQECVRGDIVEEALRVGTRVIATSDQLVAGLPNFSEIDNSEVIRSILSNDTPAVVIQDPIKVGEIAVHVAKKNYQTRSNKGLDVKEVLARTADCSFCEDCTKSCPIGLNIGQAVNNAKNGDTSSLVTIFDECIGCARCDSACTNNIPVMSVIDAASDQKVRDEKFTIRAGRGPISDTEIRRVGRPIVMGEIPGVVAFVGCANYPGGNKDLVRMADEFAKRQYIVIASGCAAADIARYRDEHGQTLYEKYPGEFDAGGLINTGSCVSNAHAIGAVIKIASIFAKRKLRGNFEEIADYILNRVGAVAVAWGTQHQKAMSIATGANRLGIPVILGPQGIKYRREYLGRDDNDDNWTVLNARNGNKVYGGPAPQHLLCSVETVEEVMVTAARLVMRPNDTNKGRMIKISNYIDLHRRQYGDYPDDLHRFVRSENDLPITLKAEIMAIIKDKGWEPVEIPDPTILDRMVIRKE